jgi:hypothetical protein
MSKKRRKYLVETSAVRPALGQSTPKHCEHFQQEVEDGDLDTSFYVRMEFIRRWVCEAARLAFSVAHFHSVEAALYYLEQEFSQRKNKAVIATIATFLRQVGPLASAQAAAEECAGLALRWLTLFDTTFPRKARNTCGCRIGGMNPDVDYNNLLSDLNAFYRAFTTPVLDCPVNKFLQLGKRDGRPTPLLADRMAQALPVIKTLAQYAADATWVTCAECVRIGDAIIALEQPASRSLVHTDQAFNKLCPPLRRDHKPIQSARAFDQELHAVLNPKPE